MLILQSRQITVFILLTEESSRIKEGKQYEVPIDISQYPAQQEKAVRAIISICFSVMLIFSSINAYISFQDMRLQNAYQTNGEYNITLHNVTYKVRDWILEQYKDQATLGVEK